MGFGAAAAADAAVGLTNTIVSGASAKRARDEYYYYSRRAHRDEVYDLEKAGLNPVLSAGGPGAPVSMGPTAQSNIPGRALEAYTAKSRFSIESKVADANIALIRANTAASEAQARRTSAEEEQIRLNILSNPFVVEQLKSAARAQNAKAFNDELDSRKKKAFAPFWDAAGQGINNIMQMYPGLIEHVARKIVDFERSLSNNKNPDTGLWNGKILGAPILDDPGTPRPGTIKYPFRKNKAPAYRKEF